MKKKKNHHKATYYVGLQYYNLISMTSRPGINTF